MEGQREANQRYLKEVRDRHPHRASACGALLAEILAAEDLRDRREAAFMFGTLGCTRGLKQLERLIDEFERCVGECQGGWEGFNTPEMQMLWELLRAVGNMDTRESHALLARIIRESKNSHVRAGALTAATWEERFFDASLALPFLSPDTDPYEIFCALYALQFKPYLTSQPEDAIKLIAPLLRHPSRLVRAQAVTVLAYRVENRPLVLSLQDDPDEQVRNSVADGLQMLELFEQDADPL